MQNGTFEHLIHVCDLRGVRAGDETGPGGEQLFHRIDGAVEAALRIGLRFTADWGGGAGLVFSQAVDEIVHDDVRQADIFPGGVVEVITADGESVANNTCPAATSIIT